MLALWDEPVPRFAEAGVDRLILEPRSSAGTAADELIAMASDELIGRA
jgi:hypothetical protein